MKFSILIPVYNVEKYLEECLNSVMKQDFLDFEVILVDDGSTDRSGTICDSYQSKYPEQVKVIHKGNQGLISARRVGIANAKGDYCVFVDSDDMVEGNLLGEVNRCIAEYDMPDIVMYSFRYLREGKTAEQYPHRFADSQIWIGDQKKELYLSLLSEPAIDALWIKAIRTTILKSDPIPYEKYYSRNMSEDTLQSIYPLTVANKVVFIKKPLYLYRIIDTSISHNYSVETLEKKNTNHVYYTICEYLPQWGLDDEETHQKLQARWFNEAMYTFCNYYESSNQKESREAILAFDWNQMIPFTVESNKYYHDIYWKIYQQYKKHNVFCLWWLFTKKGYVKRIRKIKSLLCNIRG